MHQFLRIVKSQIQYTIILPYLGLTVLVMLAGASITLFFVTGDLQERFNNQLREVGTRMRAGIEKQEADNLNLLYQMAFAPENTNPGRSAPAVATAMAERDINGLKRALTPYYQLNALRTDWVFDRMIAFDTQGKALVDWQRNAADPTSNQQVEFIGTDLSGVPEVQRVNAGINDGDTDKYTAFMQFLSDRDQYYFYTVVPVKSGDKRVGGLLLAARLDHLIPQLEQQSQSAVSVFYDSRGLALASTAPSDVVTTTKVIIMPSSGLKRLDMSPEVLNQFAAGSNQSVLSVPINNRSYEFAYAPLRIRGQQIGYYSVALARDFIFNTITINSWVILGITTALALSAVVMGYLISQRITRPLRELVSTAQAVSHGQLDQRSMIVTTQNELGTLAQAFNQMTEHLLRLYATSSDLNKAIDVRAVLDVACRAASDFVPGTEALALLQEHDGWRYSLGTSPSPSLQLLNDQLSDVDPLILEDILTTRPQQPLEVATLPTLSTELGTQAGMQTALCTRLFVLDRLVGVLALVNPERDVFDESAIPSLTAISNMAVTVLQNALLYARVQHDATERQAILQSIADGVVVCDTQHYIVMANKTAEQMLNLHDWTTFKYQFNSIPLCKVTEHNEFFGSIQGDEHYEINGRTLALSRAPVIGDDDEAIGEVIVLHDLSTEAAVSQAKTDFIATISHELRTPLTPIFVNLDMMLRGYMGKLSDDQNNAIRQVRHRANDINDIVKNMIMIASIEANTLTIDLQPQDLLAAVEASLAPLRSGFAAKGLSIDVRIPPDLPMLMADREMLKIVLTQLLDNARRFTMEGGVTVTAQVIDDTVQVDVIDTGIGIAQEAQGKLFKRFQRVEGNNSPERGGGLGLAITRQIIERQGGRVWVRSSPNQGSTFSFVLPQIHEQAFAVAQTEEVSAT